MLGRIPPFSNLRTDVRITKGAKSFEARARVDNQPSKGMGLMFTAVEPDKLGLSIHGLPSPARPCGSRLIARSQRVLMKIPVRVSGQVGVGLPFEEETHTLAISAHGALIVVAAPVYRGQRFTLSNVQRKRRWSVLWSTLTGFRVSKFRWEVEFMLPHPTFWRVERKLLGL